MAIIQLVIPASLGEYVDLLKQTVTSHDPCTPFEGFTFEKKSPFVLRCESFLKHYPKPITVSRLRSVTASFCEVCEIPLPKMCFPMHSRDFAYMTDDGILSICLMFVLFTDKKRIFKVLIHELSHLLLLHQGAYGDLLKLDSLFFKAEGSEHFGVISPVEFYATSLSCSILHALAEVSDGRLRDVFTHLGNDEKLKLKDTCDAYLACLSGQ